MNLEDAEKAIRVKFREYTNETITLEQLSRWIVEEVELPFYTVSEQTKLWKRKEPNGERPLAREMTFGFLLRLWEYQDFPSLGEEWVKEYCEQFTDQKTATIENKT